MNQLKLEIMYDGSAYCGWQKGVNAQTIANKNGERYKTAIQDVIEETLSKFFIETVSIQGAGRTDAGVHALGQIANFLLTKRIFGYIMDYCSGSLEILRNQLNKLLPDDIQICGIAEVSHGFHSRFSAVNKIYCYRFDERERENPFTRRYTYHAGEELNLAAMKKAADYLIGTHDFKAFCTETENKKSTVRTIHWIKFYRIWDNNRKELDMQICGDGFLYHMVRIIAGTLLEVGNSKRRAESLEEAMLILDRQKTGITLAPKGLCLLKIKYD